VVLAESMLFTELVKVEGDWLWHNDWVGSMSEAGFGYFVRLVIEAKDRMENITGDAESIAWCG
jgi:hypothetical protein